MEKKWHNKIDSLSRSLLNRISSCVDVYVLIKYFGFGRIGRGVCGKCETVINGLWIRQKAVILMNVAVVLTCVGSFCVRYVL